MHLIYKQLSLYINLYIKKKKRFSIAQWRFTFHCCFSHQIEFDLKSVNQEFLLFLKSLNFKFKTKVKRKVKEKQQQKE